MHEHVQVRSEVKHRKRGYTYKNSLKERDDTGNIQRRKIAVGRSSRPVADADIDATVKNLVGKTKEGIDGRGRRGKDEEDTVVIRKNIA